MDSWPVVAEQSELGTLSFVYCTNGCVLPLLMCVRFSGPFEAT